MGATRAAANRKVRQDALREQLAGQGHVQHAVDIIGKLKDLDDDLDPVQVQRLSKAMDGHFKFINKYLPELKATELSTLDEDGKVTGFQVKFTDAKTSTDTE